jgi:beclin
MVLSSLQARLTSATRERDAYINCLKDLKSKSPTDAAVHQAETELEAAKTDEERAYSELLSLEKEKVALEEELADLDAESRELDREEEEFWRSRNAFDLRYSSMKELKDALEASYQHDLQQLERLRRTNV